MFLAIDPGIDTGWAVFTSSGELTGCGVGVPPMDTVFTQVVIECPQVYSARHSKGDPNDLITLAVQVGRYVERYRSKGYDVRLTRPHDWKGNVPKDVQHRRMMKTLTPSETFCLEAAENFVAKGKRHNMYDAVGIGKAVAAGGVKTTLAA